MRRSAAYVVVSIAGLLVAAGNAEAAPATASAGGQGAAASAPAQTPGAGAPGASMTQQHRSWVMGNVIESRNGHVAINTENGTMLTLRVTPGTDVAVDGQKASPQDLKLKPGADVFAAYEGSGQQPTARILEVDQTGRGLHGAPSHAPNANASANTNTDTNANANTTNAGTGAGAGSSH